MKQKTKGKVYEYKSRRITLDGNLLDLLDEIKDTNKLNVFIENILKQHLSTKN